MGTTQVVCYQWLDVHSQGRQPAHSALACLFLALALLSPPAHASAASRNRPGRFKLGPLYLTPKIELKNVGVDSNVYNSGSAVISDTQVVLSPGIEAALPIGRRLRFSGSGSLGLNYFQRQSSERSTDRAAEGRGEIDLGPFTFFGGGGGGQYKQRFSIDIDPRLLRQEKWGQAGARLRLTRRISLTGAGTSRVYRFESTLWQGVDVRQALDRNTLSASVQGRFALTNLTTLLVSAEGIEDRFLNPGSGRNRSRLVQSFRYLGGFEFGQRALINGRVLAGYREFPGSGGQSAPAYRGPVLSISATLPVLRFGRLAVAGDRDVHFAARGDVRNQLRNTLVSTRYAGQLSFELPFSLLGHANASYEQLRYVLPHLTASGYVRRADNQYLLGGSLLRRLGDSVRIGGTASWVRRVSNLETGSYQGLSYGLQAEVVP